MPTALVSGNKVGMESLQTEEGPAGGLVANALVLRSCHSHRPLLSPQPTQQTESALLSRGAAFFFLPSGHECEIWL